ncbi:hypothetical protein L8Q94_20030, partial [Enterobacter kobei]|nr:hypothetical protein [Enterobacter kobei]
LLCHGTVCVVGKIRDLILQLSKSSIYSTKPLNALKKAEPTSKRWTQEALKAEMLDRGLKLSSRLLDEYFSSANKSFKS